jgi:hypothetical protein
VCIARPHRTDYIAPPHSESRPGAATPTIRAARRRRAPNEYIPPYPHARWPFPCGCVRQIVTGMRFADASITPTHVGMSAHRTTASPCRSPSAAQGLSAPGQATQPRHGCTLNRARNDGTDTTPLPRSTFRCGDDRHLVRDASTVVLTAHAPSASARPLDEETS